MTRGEAAVIAVLVVLAIVWALLILLWVPNLFPEPFTPTQLPTL